MLFQGESGQVYVESYTYNRQNHRLNMLKRLSPSCRPCTNTPEFGPLANPRGSLSYKWQVLFNTVARGEYTFETIQPYLDQLAPLSGYKLCPGISEYPQEIRFKTKNLREWGLPFNRLDSQACLLWHIPSNVRHPLGDPLRDVCTVCRRLTKDICQLLQRSWSTTEGQKLSRVSVGSNYPLAFLSPTSKGKWMSRVTKE